jgi:hypothetical protein
MTVSKDRFGNDYTVIGCKPDKKNAAFNHGYVTIKGTNYKVEVSNSNKDGVSYWVKLTKMPPRNNNRNNF